MGYNKKVRSAMSSKTEKKATKTMRTNIDAATNKVIPYFTPKYENPYSYVVHLHQHNVYSCCALYTQSILNSDFPFQNPI